MQCRTATDLKLILTRLDKNPLKKTTYRKEYKIFLVALSNTVVNPWAMVIHFPNAPLADGAMMCSIRLDTAAFWTLENHLAFFKSHLRNVFFGGISPRHSSLIVIFKIIFGVIGDKLSLTTYRITEHCPDMRRDC